MYRYIQKWFLKVWYSQNRWYLFFTPLSCLFYLLSTSRRWFYKNGFLRRYKAKYPVIVIGNITVGGTGKTPIVIWIANYSISIGYKPAIISRGYSGKVGSNPIEVSDCSDVRLVGDEALMIAIKSDCPVIIHPDRVLALKYLAGRDIDLVISDDGLQHYKLHRDYEIVTVDGQRMFGNNRLLPAGPLRESISRLDSVDTVLIQKETTGHNQVGDFYLDGEYATNLISGEVRAFEKFLDKNVHAIAGIGNPERFFRFMTNKGFNITQHHFEDHKQYSLKDITFNDELNVFMTEKDMTKCQDFNNEKLWYVPVDVVINDSNIKWLNDIKYILDKGYK